MLGHIRKAVKFFLISQVLPFPIYAFLTLYCMSLKFKIENAEAAAARYQGGGRIVLASWHQRFFGGFYLPKLFGLKIPIMISQSRDGDFIANVVRYIGWYPVRGSSSRRGREALKEMISAARLNRLAVHIVDGPSGPASVIKPGLVSLARESGASIVPVYVSYEKPIVFNSWDRYMIPRPFSRVLLRFDDAKEVRGIDADRAGVDNYLSKLGETMYEGYRKADDSWSQTSKRSDFRSLAFMKKSPLGRLRSD